MLKWNHLILSIIQLPCGPQGLKVCYLAPHFSLFIFLLIFTPPSSCKILPVLRLILLSYTILHHFLCANYQLISYQFCLATDEGNFPHHMPYFSLDIYLSFSPISYNNPQLHKCPCGKFTASSTPTLYPIRILPTISYILCLITISFLPAFIPSFWQNLFFELRDFSLLLLPGSWVFLKKISQPYRFNSLQF